MRYRIRGTELVVRADTRHVHNLLLLELRPVQLIAHHLAITVQHREIERTKVRVERLIRQPIVLRRKPDSERRRGTDEGRHVT